MLSVVSKYLTSFRLVLLTTLILLTPKLSIIDFSVFSNLVDSCSDNVTLSLSLISLISSDNGKSSSPSLPKVFNTLLFLSNTCCLFSILLSSCIT